MIIRRGGDVRTHKGAYSQAGILTQKTVTEASRWKDVLLLLLLLLDVLLYVLY